MTSHDDRRPQTYREWLDNRFNDEAEDDEDLDEAEPDDPEGGDGFPLHDKYDEESFP